MTANTNLNTVDVRMRGFVARTRVEEALAWVDAHALPLATEEVPLEQAHGRVLAKAIHSPLDVPAFDRSAMDGYALQAAGTDGAGPFNPLRFRVLGASMPGQPFRGEVSPDGAVRIMTGAPLPRGADAVIPVEHTTVTAAAVEVTAAVSPGKHVGRCGEDVAEGAVLMDAGRRLRPQDVALVASVGLDRLSVIRRPRVRVLITGNELVQPGQPKSPYAIYDANSSMLRGLVERDGGELESVRLIPDDRSAISAAMSEPGADLILVSGGSSVGAEDHAPTLLAELGELAVHGVAMRPSSPAGMGAIGRALVFLLPGNPVSCLCAYDFFAGRAVRLLGGQPGQWPYVPVRTILSRKIASAVGRVDYCRVRLTEENAEPIALNGAAILSSVTRADGFVVVPEASEGFAPGTEVTVWRYAL